MSDLTSISSLSPAVSLGTAQANRTIRDIKASADQDPAKVQKAAREFEAILLGQWLEQARHAFAGVPGENTEENSDPAHDQMQSLALQAVAARLSSAGGVGIGTMILKHLNPAAGGANEPKSQPGSEPAGVENSLKK